MFLFLTVILFKSLLFKINNIFYKPESSCIRRSKGSFKVQSNPLPIFKCCGEGPNSTTMAEQDSAQLFRLFCSSKAGRSLKFPFRPTKFEYWLKSKKITIYNGGFDAEQETEGKNLIKFDNILIHFFSP